MKTIEIVKFSPSQNHTKLVNFMRDWSKRKEEKTEQKRADYKTGKYNEIINRLRTKKNV